MATLLPVDQPLAIERAGEALLAGAVVALPTDTVYGLSVALDRPGATARLAALKGRPAEVPFAVLVAGTDQLDPITGPLEAPAARLAARFWPGPLTLVVARREDFDVDLGGDEGARSTVGIRWPASAVVETLARRAGPLVTTSANRHGLPPAATASDVLDAFGEDDRLPLVLDGGPRTASASMVVDCTGKTLRCLRDGPLDWTEIVEQAGTAGDGGTG